MQRWIVLGFFWLPPSVLTCLRRRDSGPTALISLLDDAPGIESEDCCELDFRAEVAIAVDEVDESDPEVDVPAALLDPGLITMEFCSHSVQMLACMCIQTMHPADPLLKIGVVRKGSPDRVVTDGAQRVLGIMEGGGSLRIFGLVIAVGEICWEEAEADAVVEALALPSAAAVCSSILAT